MTPSGPASFVFPHPALLIGPGVNTIYTICGSEYAQEILMGRNSEFQWTWREYSPQ